MFRYYAYVPGDYLPPGTRLVHITDNPSEAARAAVGDSILGDPGTACGVLAELVSKARRPAPYENATAACLVAEEAPADA